MNRYRIAMVLVSSFLFALAAISAEKGNLKEIKDDKYKPGQIWSYKTRPGEETSTLTILRIDEATKGKRIVHIQVDGIRLKNCKGGPEPDTVAHMPFAKEFIDKSVTEQLRVGPVPSFAEGYDEWRKGWDAGKAGFYTIPVSKAIEVMQQTFNQGLGCSR